VLIGVVGVDYMYVLITPARDEEQFIGGTLESVVSQTVRPMEWIIVNDGSTDHTQEIVRFFAEKYPFIRLLNITRCGERSFASKSLAFKAGFDHVQSKTYEFIGNIDADISFQDNYFESVLREFRQRPHVGIAGGIISELINDRFIPQKNSGDSVAGAVQLFRRKCFEDVGGYMPLKAGAIDSVAEIMARSYGWRVMALPELPVKHHRSVGRGMGSAVAFQFRQGITFYQIGYHPLFQILRSFYRFIDRPFVASAVSMLTGYFWAFFMRYEIIMPQNVVKFLRKEQMGKLRSMLFLRQGNTVDISDPRNKTE
jgi:poly-beta-1,6-N-acetyl-D-glucosamine synthase